MAIAEETRYFAYHVARDFESERLLNLQAAVDPLSTKRLERVGVGPGWRCLEVGAGRGSIARWLAEQVAPRGHVVATDMDLRLLDHLEGQRRFLEVRRHDIVADELEPNAFDLAHCRHVLMHVSDAERALERMVGSLRPGGWLVVEEPVFCDPVVVTREHAAAGAYERVMRTFVDVMSSRMDVRFGETAMRLVAQMGLDEFTVEETRLYAHGGHPGPITNMLTWEMVRNDLLEADGLYPDDLDVASAAMLDPSFICSSPFLYGVFARKPWV
ncbi:MAG TPA: methyltransferase domain-containing protein [Actinomycetota bacterium]|jgi:SAM-dependent methyltransferase|nr:methyltransferase domain-containing protein [Actinomycetota bacterium]